MTNLEKLKAEIAEMSAEEFANFLSCRPNDKLKSFIKYCENIQDDECELNGCANCCAKWLNEESEEKG